MTKLESKAIWLAEELDDFGFPFQFIPITVLPLHRTKWETSPEVLNMFVAVVLLLSKARGKGYLHFPQC